MLKAIRSSDRINVLARQAEKKDGPFSCPKCQRETVLRKGRINIPHFAHKPPIYCEYGKGESDLHRRCKEEIFQALLKCDGLQHCEIEKDLGAVVPDIYIVYSNFKVAIEVQISTLTMDAIIKRTQEYYKRDINVLWLPMFNDNLMQNRYAPKSWEKWLHAAYFGQVYYWQHDLSIIPVHFDDYQMYVEASYWYTSGGYEESAGGYFRKSKRYRTPRIGQVLTLLDDFVPNQRQAWRGGKIVVPESKLLIAKRGTWRP